MNIRTNFEELSRGVIGSYERYNGFYTRPNMRKIIYDLYDGKCAVTGQPIALEDADIGHIVPRSRADIFNELYPSLDVDNAINLHLLSSWVNKRNNDAFLPAPLVIHNAVSFAANLDSTKMDAILKYADGLNVAPLRERIPATEGEILADLNLYDDLLELMSSSGGKYLFAQEGNSSLSGGHQYERLQGIAQSLGGSIGCLEFVDGDCIGLGELEVPKNTKISRVYRDVVDQSETGLMFRRDQLAPVKAHIEDQMIPRHEAKYPLPVMAVATQQWMPS